MVSIFFEIIFAVGSLLTVVSGIGIVQKVGDYQEKIKMVETTSKDACQVFYEYRQRIADEQYRTSELLDKRIHEIEEELKTKNVVLSEKQLIIGYEKSGLLKYPIIVDMSITPHILVCGLSNSGKTKMVEFAIKNKNAVILNADVKKDFRDFNCRKINDIKEMLAFLKSILEDTTEREIPLYIVIDELLVLSNHSEITKAVMDLLAVARHKNVYVIGISQSGEKEVLKYKHLFNVRICFRMVEESCYRTVLGYSPEEKDLKHRQFLYYSDVIGSGYTYDVG
jgi:Cdc6-like AAA superfamily ATPase